MVLGKDTSLDMLNGTLGDKILMFALPVALTVVLEQLFNAVDIAVVGNFASSSTTTAIAAVGANAPIVGILVMLFLGISLGTNVVIAQTIGAGNATDVRHAVHTSVIVALAGGALVAAAGQVVAMPLLTALNMPPEVLGPALVYLRVYLLGMSVIFLYMLTAAIFRSVGEASMPLQALIVANVVNIALDLLFVCVLHWDVAGVAAGTVLANCISAGILLWRLLQRQDVIRLELKQLHVDRNALRGILRIGVPAGVQNAVFAFANVVIQGAINSLGTVVIAASSAALPIEMLAYSVFSSFGQACTTFVGQNFGARHLQRCKKILGICLLENACATGIAIALVLLFGKQLLYFINTDPEVVNVGYQRLTIVFSAYCFSLVYDTISGYLRGFGISFLPSVLTIIGVCGVRLLWVFFVFPDHRSFEGIMTVYPVSLATAAVLLIGALLWCRPAKMFK